MEEKVNSGEQTATPAVDTTKIISERLSAMRSKDREELAKAMGFESWATAMNSGMDKKLLDAGIDPELGKPIINDLVENHPDVKKAREVLAEAEATKHVAGLEIINSRFGTSYQSLDDLDEETRNLVNKGLSVSQAYAAIHYADFSANTPKPSAEEVAKLERSSSLKHLQTLPGVSAKSNNDITLNQEDIRNVRRFMPNATEEQIKAFKEKYKM